MLVPRTWLVLGQGLQAVSEGGVGASPVVYMLSSAHVHKAVSCPKGNGLEGMGAVSSLVRKAQTAREQREVQATVVLSDEQCPVHATGNAILRTGLLHWRAVRSIGHGRWEGS